MQAADEHIEAKQLTLMKRSRAAALIQRTVETMDDDGRPAPPGCGLCALIKNRLRSRRGAVALGTAESASAASKTATQARLESAGEAMRARAAVLAERLETQRQEAGRLLTSGKRAEALLALKRSKQTEKQLTVASSTMETLESQIALMEEAKLQQEVSVALAASVKSVKKGTKGLLDRTEKAVDGSHEVRDLNDDMQSALEGLKPADALDDDELLEELQAMIGGDSDPPSAVVSGDAASVSAKDVAVELTTRFPAAPKNGTAKRQQREGERVQLLAADSAGR